MLLKKLRQKIKDKHAVLSVIGLGYVGLPVACIFAKVGFQVIGVDIDAERVNRINQGLSPIEGYEPDLTNLLKTVTGNKKLQATTDYQKLAKAHVILISVETPVNENNQPQYVALKSACQGLGKVMAKGTLVIIESTIAPGTVDNVVLPILEKMSGMQAHKDFFVGACPERVMPGKLLANLRNMSRVCGGGTLETAETMVRLYRHIVEADLDTADIITAELVKTTENTYRDVQIAFANEVAMICEANGANVWRVRELVNKSPSRNMHLPGTGVGGHCIPKDPWLLAYSVRDKVPLRLIPSARAVNDHMPIHVGDLINQALNKHGKNIANAKVLLLGYAYLENSDDTRNSPTKTLVSYLQKLGTEVIIHDPYLVEYQGDVVEKVSGCDAVVLMVKHDVYGNLDFDMLKKQLRSPILIDGRGFFEPHEIKKHGLIYYGIGY